MVTATRIDLLLPVLSDAGWDSDPTSDAQQEPLPEKAGPELSEELGAESVMYPDWRLEELARKYSDEPREERHERGIYHPYD